MVSIIIPIYNAERYIDKCICSIITQSFRNFELILIDDGSKDKSLSICNDFAIRDDRIKVYTLENGGAAKARNYGLKKAQGDFIWFIDADDWIEADFLNYINWESFSDLLFFGFKRIINGNVEICQIQCFDNTYYEDFEKILSILFTSSNQYFGFTWNKIFRMSIIRENNIKFNENLIIKEDEAFTFEYCQYISSLSVSCATPYCYNILENSLSHSVNRKRNMLELAQYLERITDSYIYRYFKLEINKVILTYYIEAIIENRGKPQCEDAINGCLDFYQRNIDNIDIDGKKRYFFMVPTRFLKYKIIQFYYNYLG